MDQRRNAHESIGNPRAVRFVPYPGGPLLEKVRYPWEALSGIGAFIAALGPTLSQEEYASPRPGVWIHKTAVLAPTAFVGETVIIGPRAEVRHGAFIRGTPWWGKGPW